MSELVGVLSPVSSLGIIPGFTGQKSIAFPEQFMTQTEPKRPENGSVFVMNGSEREFPQLWTADAEIKTLLENPELPKSLSFLCVCVCVITE